MSQAVESVASIRARAEQRLDRHQRMMEVLTAALGRPRTVYAILLLLIGAGEGEPADRFPIRKQLA
jgi:hypothetical protein